MSTAAPSPLAAHVDKLLKVAADNGATELRISGGREPMVRIKDKLVTLKSPALTAEQVAGITAAIVPEGADPKKFIYASAIGRYQGSAVDVQGTKVLVLQPAGPAEAEPAAAATQVLELETIDDKADAAEAAKPSEASVYALPKVAVGNIQIDKLLTAAVKNGVSDIHITVGLPPVFRMDGGMRPQNTKVLTGDDTNGLMKAITPERCQAELAEKGGCDFGFAFGDMARFRVSVFKQRGTIAMVLRQIPNKMLTPEQLAQLGTIATALLAPLAPHAVEIVANNGVRVP